MSKLTCIPTTRNKSKRSRGPNCCLMSNWQETRKKEVSCGLATMPASMYNRAYTNQITLRELASLSKEEARALRYVGRLPDTRLCSQERTKHKTTTTTTQNNNGKTQEHSASPPLRMREILTAIFVDMKKVLLRQKTTQGARNRRYITFTHTLNERVPYG